MRVANKRIIRRLSFKSMRAARLRNVIAVIAISLTTLLFTALFTIVMSIGHSFEQSNFRQIGGYAHGGFKYLTKEQVEELKTDPLIKEWGLRRFVGIPNKAPFNKSQVEISYADANWAKWGFLEPKEGRFPTEGTKEAATDTSVLKLLGVEPKIGAEFTITFNVDGQETTQTFTLCGYWDYDEAIVANHVIIPQSRAGEIFDELDTKGLDKMTGTYNLDVMLQSKANIEKTMKTILEKHGYQSDNRSQGDNYIAIGVNWGYISSQLSDSMDFETIVSLAIILIVIIFTGYLIIYNVFQISVSNDIRFYGLLKTIGTTGKQIKRIVLYQAVSLSVIGIPIGLILGYAVGAVLTPVVLENLDGIDADKLSLNPMIFAGAALFSLATLMISCRKPAKTASKVSPIEAVRYTENSGIKRVSRKNKNSGASIYKMAFANMGRNKSKTIVTVASMSLAVVLLNLTFLFTNGFDMDKYVESRMISDFLLADASYFQVGTIYDSNENTSVSEEVITRLHDVAGISDGGRTYGLGISAQEFVTEEWMRKLYGNWYSSEELENMLTDCEKENDLYQTRVQLYGMEKFCLDKCKLIEGDISKLYDDSNYVAAVYLSDDYDNPINDTNWAKIGDKVKIRYVTEWEYYNPETGEIYNSIDNVPNDMPVDSIMKEYHDSEYEVAALITIPGSMTYRYYGTDEFVMSAEAFKTATGTENIMYYTYDVDKTKARNTENMETFLKDFTTNKEKRYDYESKQTYKEEFYSFQTMFNIMGGALSFIVGLVGILNFLNAILTGIITRRREFAVLQSVGMTGKQLKAMLVYEGLIYAMTAVFAAILLNIFVGPFAGKLLEDMFWFFSYRFIIMPSIAVTPVFVLIGVGIPLLSYRMESGKSIVERLSLVGF